MDTQRDILDHHEPLVPDVYTWVTMEFDFAYREVNGCWCVQGSYTVDGEGLGVEIWLPANLPHPLPPHKMDEEDTDSPQPMGIVYMCAKYLHRVEEAYPGPDMSYDVYTVGNATPMEHEYGS